MKLYLIKPVTLPAMSKAAIEVRLKECVEPIAELILPYLLADPAIFGMMQDGEVSDAPVPMTERYGYAKLARLADEAVLREALLACGDPFSGKWMLIRSLVTCRSVFYGYDGQAFVCLQHEDEAIVSPNRELIEVTEQTQMLIETDWMDGLRSN